MNRFEPGLQKIWQDFCLDIVTPLSFEQGKSYQLQGPNGSGKSSFISQLLIPRLRQEEAYILHFEQQAQLQLQSLRAWAAIFRPHQPVKDEAGMVSFLLNDLILAWQKQPRAVWIVADELHEMQAITSLDIPLCLIYCAHHQALDGARQIIFEPVSSSRSRVYA